MYLVAMQMHNMAQYFRIVDRHKILKIKKVYVHSQAGNFA